MATPNSVKILEVSHVSPSKDSPNSSSEFSLPLTFFDTFWFNFHSVERLFFYSLSNTNNLATDSFLDSILPKLKRSLSLTLNHFLPLAGTLTWPQDSPNPIVLYTPGNGVSLTVAESTSNFALLVSRVIHDASALRHLVPQLSVSDTGAPAIAVQITVFPSGAGSGGGGGFCVGIIANHTILDGKSTIMFMKAWAHICKELKENKISEKTPLLIPNELTPSYDRTVIKDPTGLDYKSFIKRWFSLTDFEKNSSKSDEHDSFSDLVRSSFELSRSNIEKLREKVSLTWNKLQDRCPNKLHLSSFVVALAYVLACLLKATDNKKSNPKKVYFGFTADYRNRTEPPVPDNYFGNYVSTYFSFTEGRDLLGRVQEEDDDNDRTDLLLSGTTIIAAKLSEMIVKELVETKDVLEGFEERVMKIATLALRQDVEVVGVSGSPRFGVYGVDFGWGRPEKVEMASLDHGTGGLSMSESRDGNKGIEVGLVLKKHEMDLFVSLFRSGLETI